MTMVLEGTWEEIAARAPELAGRQVRLLVFELPSSTANRIVDLDRAKRRADEFREWANSHPPNQEPLSDYAISRENMYRDDL